MTHRPKVIVVDVTKQFGDILEKRGFGSDRNDSLDISKAGIWDLMDASFGDNNKKFTKKQAQDELEKRGI